MAAPIPKHFRKDWLKLEGASPNWVAQIQNEVVIDKQHYNWAFLNKYYHLLHYG
jgi:hypothetical protein